MDVAPAVMQEAVEVHSTRLAQWALAAGGFI